MFRRKGQTQIEDTVDIETMNIGSVNFLDVRLEQFEVLKRLKGIENKMASIEQELVDAKRSN